MTDPVRALLGRVKELDEKATGGPWEVHVEMYQSEYSDYHAAHIPNVAEKIVTEYEGEYPPFLDIPDAELVAEFRTAAPALARALEAVLEVHQPFTWDFGYGPLESCKGCADQGAGDHDYPCPTVQAITEHLGGET